MEQQANTRAEIGTTQIRLLVELLKTSETHVAEREVEEAAQATLTSHSDVQPLFGRDETDQHLQRFFEVTATFPSASVSRYAWAAAHDLRARLGGIDAAVVVPDLPSTLYMPALTRGAPSLIDQAPDLPGSENKLWALDNIRAPAAWLYAGEENRPSMGEGVLVGHPDTGYHTHVELDTEALNLALGADFVANDPDPWDPLDQGPLLFPGHGTRTASVIVGRDAGTLCGVAPKAHLVPVRVGRGVVHFLDGQVAKAVNHLRKAGVDVISMSLGGRWFRGLEAAINKAVANGVIVMAAAGNWDWLRFGGLRIVVWPAAYRTCIAVAATNADDLPWAGSARGRKVFVSAPGESVWAPRLPGSEVFRSRGTSYGVAHVAGAACLWVAFHNKENLLQRFGPAGVQAAFTACVERGGHRRPSVWDVDTMGVGIVDAEALLRTPLPDPSKATQLGTNNSLQTIQEAIHHALPELTREDADERLSALFDGEEAAARRAIEEFGPELLYLLTESEQTREAFVEEVPRRLTDTRESRLRSSLADSASPQLQRELHRL